MCSCVRRLARLRQPSEARPCALELPGRRTWLVVAGGSRGPGGSAGAAAPIRGPADHANPGQRSGDPVTTAEVSFAYIETTIPPGLTVPAYRWTRTPRSRRWRTWFKPASYRKVTA